MSSAFTDTRGGSGGGWDPAVNPDADGFWQSDVIPPFEWLDFDSNGCISEAELKLMGREDAVGLDENCTFADLSSRADTDTPSCISRADYDDYVEKKIELKEWGRWDPGDPDTPDDWRRAFWSTGRLSALVDDCSLLAGPMCFFRRMANVSGMALDCVSAKVAAADSLADMQATIYNGMWDPYASEPTKIQEYLGGFRVEGEEGERDRGIDSRVESRVLTGIQGFLGLCCRLPTRVSFVTLVRTHSCAAAFDFANTERGHFNVTLLHNKTAGIDQGFLAILYQGFVTFGGAVAVPRERIAAPLSDAIAAFVNAIKGTNLQLHGSLMGIKEMPRPEPLTLEINTAQIANVSLLTALMLLLPMMVSAIMYEKESKLRIMMVSILRALCGKPVLAAPLSHSLSTVFHPLRRR